MIGREKCQKNFGLLCISHNAVRRTFSSVSNMHSGTERSTDQNNSSSDSCSIHSSRSLLYKNGSSKPTSVTVCSRNINSSTKPSIQKAVSSQQLKPTFLLEPLSTTSLRSLHTLVNQSISNTSCKPLIETRYADSIPESLASQQSQPAFNIMKGKIASPANNFHTSSSRLEIYNITTEDDFEEKVMKSKVPVVVNFHAEWCEPCHALKPLLESLAQKFPGKFHLAEVSGSINSRVIEKIPLPPNFFSMLTFESIKLDLLPSKLNLSSLESVFYILKLTLI